MSEKSSYWYDSSPVIGSAVQITWGGADIKCGDKIIACKGTRLSEMQLSILERICSLESDVDICSVNIPDCFSSFFDPLYCTASDKTVIDFINFLLDTACNQQKDLDTKASKDAVDPIVTLEYCCCAPTCTTPGGSCCGTSVEVRLSEHIQNVLECLCKYKEEVANTYATIVEITKTNNALLALCNRVGKIETGITAWNVHNTTLAPAPNTISLANNSNPC